MSYYIKYPFTSPEIVYANVKEELKSYFDTGAVDDLMFGTWTDKCLRKIGKGAYYIANTVMFIEDFQARLPDNFYNIREAWLCTAVNGFPVQSANSFYSQAALQTTIQVSPVVTNGVSCISNCPPDACTCMPDLIQAVYKTNNAFNQVFHKQYLLKPGNINVADRCDTYCANFGSSAADSFDIHDNKFITNFRRGTVYLVFYSKEITEDGYQLVPDNYRILEFIEAFLKFKVMEQLSNQIVDETFNQIQAKLQRYEAASNEAYILADIEIKKQTTQQKLLAINAQRKSFNKYELADRTFRYGWRRNQ